MLQSHVSWGTYPTRIVTAAVTALTLREGLLPPTHPNSNSQQHSPRIFFQFFRATRGKSQTGRVRYENGKPCGFLFPTASSRPVPSLVSVPTVYHPAVAVSCSPQDRFLSHCCLPSCCDPVLTCANRSVSHSIYRRFCRCPIIHVAMDATGL